MKLRSLLVRVFGGEHEPHVLCADDDPNVRALCSAALRRAGYAVDEAADGREARDKIDHNRYSAVLLDLAMPYLHEVLRKPLTIEAILGAVNECCSRDDTIVSSSSAAR